MLGTTAKVSIPFHVWKQIFFLCLGLTVTEINIKSAETRLKKKTLQM